jgi:hypothetical protein
VTAATIREILLPLLGYGVRKTKMDGKGTEVKGGMEIRV